jgi:hypothetical protein
MVAQDNYIRFDALSRMGDHDGQGNCSWTTT